MDKKAPFIHRDISWLSFNYRVLQEAKDPSVPLFERIKFLAIYSNNLGEYFAVRVAQHINLVRLGKKTKKKLDYDPKQLLKEIRIVLNKHSSEFSEIFHKQIVPELKKYNVFLLRRMDLNEEQELFVENYFQDNLMPFVQPVLLIKHKIKPFLSNAALYLVIEMRDKEKDKNSEKRQYAIVKIPSDHLPRFITLPPSNAERKDLIMLDDIVRHNVKHLFPGYNILDTYSIKLTRDAELYIDDEFSGNLLNKIKHSLTKRDVGPPSRLVIDREMPNRLLDFLTETFNLEKYGIFTEGRYHNNFDFFKFPSLGLHHLNNIPFPPLSYAPLEHAVDFFKAIRAREHLVHFPYQSYESVVRFFEEAAIDPDVTHIKIIQYRVAKKSRIMNALIQAVKNGKQVSAFIEVKARFDEEANLKWGEILEKAGVEVHYSFPGLKVHSKSALVRRIEKGKTKLYAYLSTGNFHEDTAKIYSDLGFFTAHWQLTGEISRVFSHLETVKRPSSPFKHLLVGQFNLREGLEALINKEIAYSRVGKPAKILLKMNSLQDPKMIEHLYKASKAGVEITLIIRGICCLVPGVKGWSENIKVISIVDRFLEHARVFIFNNNGDKKMYLSSADWMTRNLSYRIETVFPIYDKQLQKEVLEFIDIQLADNVKARIVDAEDRNEYQQGNEDLATRSQYDLYYYYKRKGELGGKN